MDERQTDKERAIAQFEENGVDWVREQIETERLSEFKRRLAAHWLGEHDRASYEADRSAQNASTAEANNLAREANAIAEASNAIASAANLLAARANRHAKIGSDSRQRGGGGEYRRHHVPDPGGTLI